ncbi:periplasmic heavy metal sensor [Phenylobacterium sp.]|uniref:periplasmic heavy metal sensor n=1 Tax=Phenylobacterium sp. TaxID=1871053 RepID=UPI003BACF873
MSRPLLLGALFASLALNVFIGGAFVGAHLAKDKAPPSPVAARLDERPRNPLMTALRTLPPEARKAWRESARDFAVTQGPRTRQARGLAREAMRGFGAEPFDQASTLAALEAARKAEYENRLAMDRRIVAFVATLPQDQRAAFGEALAQPVMRPERGRD